MPALLSTSRAFQAFHILRQIALILIGVFLANSSISQSDIGNYEWLMFLLFATSFFWINGTTQGLLTMYPKQQPADQQALLFQVFVFFCFMGLLATAFLSFGRNNIVLWFTNQTPIQYLGLFLVFLCFNMPTYLVENIYLLQDRAKPIIGFAVLSFVGQALAILLPLYLGYAIFYSYLSLIGLSLIKFIWLLLLMKQSSRINFKWGLFYQLLQLSLPLMLYSLLGGFAQVIDSWLVSWHVAGDKAQFAIFRYGARELPLALAIATAFSASMLPQVATDLTASLNAIKSRSLQLFHWLFPLSIVATLFSEPLFVWVFGEAFRASYLIFNVYLLILSNRLIFPHTILIGLNQNGVLFRVAIVELFINITASLVFVKYFGLMGIALGTMVAYTFEKIVYVVFLKQKYQIAFHQYTAIGWLVFYTIALWIAFLYSVS